MSEIRDYPLIYPVYVLKCSPLRTFFRQMSIVSVLVVVVVFLLSGGGEFLYQHRQ